MPYEGPCYRCLYPTPPPPELAPGCSVAGVLGVVPGIMGLLQANEVLKLLLGIGDTLAGRLLLFDALETEFTELRLRRDPECPVCSDAARAARKAGRRCRRVGRRRRAVRRSAARDVTRRPHPARAAGERRRGQRRSRSTGTTVGEVLDDARRAYPALRDQLMTPTASSTGSSTSTSTARTCATSQALGRRSATATRSSAAGDGGRLTGDRPPGRR